MAAERSRNPLVFVLLTMLIDTIGFGIIMPVLPKLIMEISAIGIAESTRIGGLLLVVFALLQFALGPVMGNLSDAYGRRPILLGSLLAFGINYALMGFAPSLPWLFAGRVVTGITGALFAPANAFIADISEPEQRAHRFALVGAAFGVGFVLGPALGGLIGGLGVRAPFFVAAGLACLNFVYGFFVLPESLPRERRRPFSIKRANPLGAFAGLRGVRGVLPLALCSFFWQTAFQVYPATWAFYAMAKFDLAPGAIGVTLAASGASMALVQGLLTGRIVKRLGESIAAPLGVAVGVASFLAYAFIDEAWMMIPILAVGGLQGVAMPSMNALMSKQLGPDRQGELQGALASVMGLAAIVGPLSLSHTLAFFTRPDAPVRFPGAAFALAAGLAAIALLLLLARMRGGAVYAARHVGRG